MKAYLSRHLQVLFATLGRMGRTPVTTTTTVVIIGLSLLLPALLYIALKSAQQLNESWQGQPQISIFLQTDVGEQESQLIFEELRLHPAIALAEFISTEQALSEFKTLSGLDFELEFLGENPLPASIVVLPTESHYDSNSLLQLKQELSKIDGIEDIKLDLEWTNRFSAILTMFQRGALVLSAVLIMALVLTIANTIKLLILNRRQEIEITKLVGGSNRFVRRPFLYFGALYGFLGAFITLIGLIAVGYAMQSPLTELSELYGRNSLIYQPSALEITGLVLFSTVLGWISARISVAQHLHRIRPS